MERRSDTRRIPQPQSDHGREIAEALWKRRHEITVRPEFPIHNVRVSPVLELRISDGTHQQYAMTTRETWRRHGDCSVQYHGQCHVASDDRARWALHTWRAVQSARMLLSIGENPDCGEAPLCIPSPENPPNPVRLLRGLLRRRDATISEILEDRLDAALTDRISRMPSDIIVTGRFGIGAGIHVDVHAFEPVILVSHADHGTIALPGRAAEALNARINAMRADAARDTEAEALGRDRRVERVIAICREAVALDPEMTDALGTPIRPLLEQHLPRLMRMRAGLEEANAVDATIDGETDAVLGQVIKAVEEGMATHARDRRDALRTELRFLAERHPVQPL
jgi:hypothetical protein